MTDPWQKRDLNSTNSAKLNPRKRADCVLREARCAATPGSVRLALRQAVAAEIDRMRALQESEDAVRVFRAATEIHIALCGAGEGHSSAIAHDRPIALHGNDVGPA